MRATCQGVVAGINAGLCALGEAPLVLDRADALIGVLIDDLVTKGADEPYRMFTRCGVARTSAGQGPPRARLTAGVCQLVRALVLSARSRSEFRLSVRSDNADLRLTLLGHQAGCVSAARVAELERVQGEMRLCEEALQSALSPHAWQRYGVNVREDGDVRSARRILASADVPLERILEAVPALAQRDRAVLERVAIEARYAGYLERQASEVDAFRRDEALALPDDLDYATLPSLSAEARERLEHARPATLGAASRIHGVTPPVLIALLKHVRRRPSRSGPTPRVPPPNAGVVPVAAV